MDLFAQLFGADQRVNRVSGPVVGVVTNTEDPDGLGRVKVKFPWLSDQDESHWARIVTPMAGPNRGIYFLPEVDDEVLLAFEHGLIEFPYILGALWNGKDKPPENDNGKNRPDRRTIKSRSGHIIRLDDTTDAEKIEIIAKGEKSTIVINANENSITITGNNDVTIQSSEGTLKLSGKAVEINSTSDAIKLTSKSGCEIKATGELKQSGANVKVEAQTTMDLKADAQLNIKGGVVNIN